MPIITKSGSVVSRIEIETSPYRKNTVAIYFAGHAAPGLLESTQKQLKEIGGGDTYMHPVYCVINGNKLREVIDLLFRNQQISAEERADVESDIRKTESNLGYIDRTVADATTAQQDMIEEFVSPYLEGIVSLSADYRKVLTLLEYPFSRNFIYERMDIYKLIGSCGKKEEECREAFECLEALRKICWGEGNLEATYKQLGIQVPSLMKQREMIVDSCLKFINAQFKLLSIDDRFHCAAELIMMSDLTQSSIHASHTKEFLDCILEGRAQQRDIFYAFVHLGGISTVLSKAATKASFTEEEKRALVDTKHSQILLECIGSDLSSPIPSTIAAAPSVTTHSLFSGPGFSLAVRGVPGRFDTEICYSIKHTY